MQAGGFDRLQVHEPLTALPTQTAEQTSQTALGTSEGFLDHSGKCPVDSLTSMPLPIAPTDDLTALLPELVNDHHHFYPKLNPALRASIGGQALRVSRIQRVAIFRHNFGDNPYHNYFPDGPEVPTTAAEQLGMCVLACALYLPDQVVDTTQGQPLVRPMKPWEEGRLRQPNSYISPLPYQVKRFRDRRFPGLPLVEAKSELMKSRKKQAELTYKNMIYGYDPMKQFMAEQVLAQNFEAINPRVTQKFLAYEDIADGLKILSIGAKLAADNAHVAGRPLEQVYAQLRAAGRLHPLMPPRACTLIKNKLGAIQYRVELLPALQAALLAQLEEPAA